MPFTGSPVEKTATSHCMTPPPQLCLTSEGKFTKWKIRKKIETDSRKKEESWYTLQDPVITTYQ